MLHTQNKNRQMCCKEGNNVSKLRGSHVRSNATVPDTCESIGSCCTHKKTKDINLACGREHRTMVEQGERVGMQLLAIVGGPHAMLHTQEM